MHIQKKKKKSDEVTAAEHKWTRGDVVKTAHSKSFNVYRRARFYKEEEGSAHNLIYPHDPGWREKLKVFFEKQKKTSQSTGWFPTYLHVCISKDAWLWSMADCFHYPPKKK